MKILISISFHPDHVFFICQISPSSDFSPDSVIAFLDENIKAKVYFVHVKPPVNIFQSKIIIRTVLCVMQ